MAYRLRNHKGFTLIELAVVVVVIGTLALLAIPRFMGSTVRSKQSEPKGILKQIYNMQRAYKQEYDAYWGNGISADAANPNNFGRISVVIAPGARYMYSIVADATSFTVTANVPSPGLDDDATPDTWVIDEGGILEATSDDSKH